MQHNMIGTSVSTISLYPYSLTYNIHKCACSMFKWYWCLDFGSLHWSNVIMKLSWLLNPDKVSGVGIAPSIIHVREHNHDCSHWNPIYTSQSRTAANSLSDVIPYSTESVLISSLACSFPVMVFARVRKCSDPSILLTLATDQAIPWCWFAVNFFSLSPLWDPPFLWPLKRSDSELCYAYLLLI